ncbi:hypothetical protein [uncultured Roseobacter sp.]|uniref:hypothetical protein n=1 Tax=uncultured Roseobacter sp. TaxID=114847 RepID=UPI00261F0AC7|nr:hypothetical protein [uncultured Roseobacter sp.]
METEWLRKAKQELLERDPQEALRDAHQLLKYVQGVEALLCDESMDAEFAADAGPGVQLMY